MCSNCPKTWTLCVGFYLFPLRHTAPSSQLFLVKILFWSVTGAEEQWERGDRWNGETGALCGGCTPRARWHCQHCRVYTLLPRSHEVRPAGAERYEWAPNTRGSLALWRHTPSFVWKGISRITTILVVNALQVCLHFKNHYLRLAVHEFHEYAENQKYSSATKTKTTCKVS